MTRQTYLERRWPDSPTFRQVANRWCNDQSFLLLQLVWNGFDRLLKEDPAKVPMSADDEAKEESLNYLLAIRIDQCKNGDEPFCVVHQAPEQSKRKRGKGRSPQPDIGFVLYDYPRAVWPLEGKMLKHEGDVGPYLAEVNDNFLTARYATFSAEGAMLGYLSQGDPEQTFALIDAELGLTTFHHSKFSNRPHRISEHLRDNVPHRSSPTSFVCHHLILCLSTADTASSG